MLFWKLRADACPEYNQIAGGSLKGITERESLARHRTIVRVSVTKMRSAAYKPLGRIISCAIGIAVPISLAQCETPQALFAIASRSVVMVNVSDDQGKPAVLGSGVVIAPSKVVTNCHVVDSAGAISVHDSSRSFPATLLYADSERDLCELLVSGLAAPPASIGSIHGIRIGDRVFAIGAPRGLELTLSEGLISSLRTLAGMRYIQTTAPISPGSSGGGLFDEQGRLIGITTFYISEGQNLNFAAPADWIADLPKRSRAQIGGLRTDWVSKWISLEDHQDWVGLLKLGGQWAKANLKSALPWTAVCEAHRQLRQFTEAVDASSQAVTIDPSNAFAWENLALSYEGLDKFDKALIAGQQTLALEPEDASTWNELGLIYTNLRQYEKALEAFEQAVRFAPNDPTAWRNLGGAYLMLSQYQKTVEAEQQALRIDPNNAKAWYTLGFAYYFEQQRDKAIDVYQRLRQLDTDLAERFFKTCILP